MSHNNKTSWSFEAWEAARPVYEAILEHPFVNELAGGTLSRDRFMFYLQQDSIYIKNYSRVLAHIASRLPDMSLTEDFLKFAADGVAVECIMHRDFLSGIGDDGVEASPWCRFYMSVLNAQATEDVAVEAAAVLPCFWVYQRVGEHIASVSGADNPYKRWIDTYSDEAFDASTRRAIAICDELASRGGDALRRAMTEIFVMCTRMEWMFWNGAYNKEGWPV